MAPEYAVPVFLMLSLLANAAAGATTTPGMVRGAGRGWVGEPLVGCGSAPRLGRRRPLG
jgi:hypothetical protein